jgi:hypothetical protein
MKAAVDGGWIKSGEAAGQTGKFSMFKGLLLPL